MYFFILVLMQKGGFYYFLMTTRSKTYNFFLNSYPCSLPAVQCTFWLIGTLEMLFFGGNNEIMTVKTICSCFRTEKQLTFFFFYFLLLKAKQTPVVKSFTEVKGKMGN